MRSYITALTGAAYAVLTATGGLAQSFSTGSERGGVGLSVAKPSSTPQVMHQLVRLEDILPASVPVTTLKQEGAPSIRVRLQAAGSTFPKIAVAAAPLAGETPGALVGLQAAFRQLKAELARNTAPVVLNTPKVYGMPGVRRDNEVKRSASDIARSEASAALKAHRALETFVKKSKATVASTAPQEWAIFRNLRPGQYVVCMMTDLRPTADSRSKPTTMVWWANLKLTQSESAQLTFSVDNGKAWQDLFRSE
jgi:hypothetical protein